VTSEPDAASLGAASSARGTSELVFTIDLGTSGPKVALFTLDGRYIAGEFEPVELVLHPPDGVEQRPSDWWEAIGRAAQRLARSHPDLGTVVAVAVTSQWSGTVAVDESGEPLMNAVIWMDARGARATRRIAKGRFNVAGYDPVKLRRWITLTGGAPSHSGKDPISHILWIESERPDVASATKCYLEPKDWINARLTGRTVATFDSIAVHWLTDNRDPERIDYSPVLLRQSGVSRSKLPDLIGATDIVGPLLDSAAATLGLDPGIPVIGGTPDVQSAAVGSGAVRDGEGHLYVGTSSWVSGHVRTKKTDLTRGIAALPSPLPGRYFIADEQETAGECLNFLRDRVLWPDDALATGSAPEDAYQRIDELASSAPPGANGVMFFPWLVGERTPVDDHHLRAAWANVSLSSTRADLVRAVLEGVALNSRWLLGGVEKFRGGEFEWLHFIGGGARSRLWAQIFADVLDREIRVVEDPIRANGRGAALLAGLALGRLDVAGIAAAVPIADTYRPNGAHRAVYDAAFRDFVSFHKHTKGWFRARHKGVR
jgi:xylulokinase